MTNREHLSRSEALNIVLEEYRSLESEKRGIAQGSFGLGTLIVIGSVGVVTAMAQARDPFDRFMLLLVLIFSQLALLSVAGGLVAMSLKFAMYLAVVEERLDRVSGRKSLLWERLGVGNWPGSHTLKLKRKDLSLKNLDPFNIAILTVVAISLLLLIGEVSYTEILLNGLVDNLGWKIAVMAGFPVITVTIAGFSALGWAKIPPWSQSIYRNFLVEEIKGMINSSIEEINKGDFSVIDDLVAIDIKNHDSSCSDLFGPKEIKRLLIKYRNIHPNLWITMRDLSAEGSESLPAEVRMKFRIAFLNKPQGETLIIKAGKIRLIHGKIVEYWGSEDQEVKEWLTTLT
jgi:hypothetical protein